MINKYDYFIFDLDGTIYRGNNIIANAAETVNRLKAAGKKIIYISNKTTGSIDEYYNFLSSFGLNIEKDEIINSTLVLKKFLLDNHKGETFFAIGEKVFINEIKEAGLSYEENPSLIKIILVTLDRTLNYEKLEIAARALENGARFYAANIDDTCPVDEGEVLDAGATISALEKRTHRKLEKHFGKPSSYMIDEIKSRLGNDLSRVLLTGDRLETDITMGNICGIDTALVSTGVKYFPNGNAMVKATYTIESVYDLIKTV